MVKVFLLSILIVLAVSIGVPWVVYVCAKVGAYGFYRGKRLFEEDSSDGKEE